MRSAERGVVKRPVRESRPTVITGPLCGISLTLTVTMRPGESVAWRIRAKVPLRVSRPRTMAFTLACLLMPSV